MDGTTRSLAPSFYARRKPVSIESRNVGKWRMDAPDPAVRSPNEKTISFIASASLCPVGKVSPPGTKNRSPPGWGSIFTKGERKDPRRLTSGWPATSGATHSRRASSQCPGFVSFC